MYELLFDQAVENDLSIPSREEQRFILASLERLSRFYSESYERELLKSGILRRLDGEWEGFYRLRLRTFRAIFKKQDDALVIFVVRSRLRSDIER